MKTIAAIAFTLGILTLALVLGTALAYGIP
jgi:hypothetical protein